MITQAQKNKMKKVFKRGYLLNIQNILREKNITNVSGKDHSFGYICNVLNGRNSDHQIEEALIELYCQTKEELAKIRIERKRIFDTKKPEARTPGKI